MGYKFSNDDAVAAGNEVVVGEGAGDRADNQCPR